MFYSQICRFSDNVKITDNRKRAKKKMASAWGNWRPPISWFPGHMAKASRQVKENITKCEVVLEIRDARVPLSSINKNFQSLLENKRKIIIYNKIDLADPRATQILKQHCEVSINMKYIRFLFSRPLFSLSLSLSLWLTVVSLCVTRHISEH
jgi:hypothetical protein